MSFVGQDATVPIFESFVAWLAITLAIAYVPMRLVNARTEQRMWYVSLKLPSFAPRNRAVFGIVWSILYTLQAVAAARIRSIAPWLPGVNLEEMLLYVALQIALSLYTPMFFRFKSAIGAVIVVFVSLVLCVPLTYLAYRIDIFSGIVFTLLAVWLIYALALSIALWLGNSAPKVARRVARSQTKRGCV